MMYDFNIDTVNMSNLPIIVKLARLAKIMESVNSMVVWREDNSEVSPGFLIESLVICILSGRKALWKLHEFWTQQDLDFFYPDLKISTSKLNEYAYQRALDKLSDINIEQLISNICLTMLQEHDLTIDILHLDTTSKSLQGSYSDEPTGDFDVNLGYSKDHRPDLKQFKIGAAVQQNGLPIMGQILSGNASDKEWNPDAVVKMNSFFENNNYKNTIFIGDSATVSSYESLKKLKGINFISRLPDNFSIVDKLKERAFQENDFETIGKIGDSDTASDYKIKSYKEELGGNIYRFIVVHSTALEKQKLITLDKKIVKSKDDLIKKSNKLSKKSFACEEDAHRSLLEFKALVDKAGFSCESNINSVDEIVFSRKGRPKKNEEGVIQTNYYIEIKILNFNESKKEKLINSESSFVLITSIMNETEYPASRILREYKHQYSIEEAFRFIKNPVYMGPIYLKTKERIESLGYVFILVLLLASYLQYRVRKSLKDKDEFVTDPHNRKNFRPSVKRIFEILEDVVVVITPQGRFFSKNINPRILKMIEWAGFSPEIYLKN